MNKKYLFALVVVLLTAALIWHFGPAGSLALLALIGKTLGIKLALLSGKLLGVFLLGSIKFICIGIGSQLCPVFTVNAMNRLSMGSPQKFTKFLGRKEKITEDKREELMNSLQFLLSYVTEPEKYLTRSEAKEHLREEVFKDTAKETIKTLRSLPQKARELFSRRSANTKEV